MRNVWIAGGVCLFLLFLAGIWIGLPRMLDSGSENPGQIAQGKPSLEEARKTPTPSAYLQPAVPGGTPRVPRLAPSPEISQKWVVQDGAPAHQTPAPTAAKLYTLRYGDRVRPMEKKDSWERVLLPDGRPAWVQQQFLSDKRPVDLPVEGESGAVKAVNGFYADINEHRLSAAYDKLSFAWKRDLDFTTFQTGYAATTGVACTVTGVSTVDADHVTVQIELVSSERRHKTTLVGSHLVVREPGGWRLDSGDLREVAAPVDPQEEEDLE